MVGTKIACPRDGRHKNNSPKGWMGGELYGRHENNLPKTGELNGQHGNNSLQGMDNTRITCQRDRQIGQLNGRHKNNSRKRWTDGELYGRHKKTHQRM